MVNIAVCDDSMEYCEIVKDLINYILSKNNINCSISTYTSGLSLIDDYKGKRFDLIFLDMEMPEIDGIETGLLIREMCDKPIIIYLTSHKEYAYESYQVKAKNYLLKPIQRDLLEKELIECMEELGEPDELLNAKDTNGVIHRIPFSEITHIQRRKEDRKLHIFTIDKDEIIVNQTLQQLEETLSHKGRFKRSGKSCIINLDNVRTIKKGKIYFYNDEAEVASRRRLSELVDLFKQKNKR